MLLPLSIPKDKVIEWTACDFVIVLTIVVALSAAYHVV